MKSLYLYKYWLVHYFSIKNNRWILFTQKNAEKIDDSHFTEIDVIVPPPCGEMFLCQQMGTTDRQYETFKVMIK